MIYREEALFTAHPQLFNWYHNAKSWNDINFLFSLMDCEQASVLDLGYGSAFNYQDVQKNADIIAVDLKRYADAT